MAQRFIPICLLLLLGVTLPRAPAAAEEARFTLPVTIYTEDMRRWSPARVDEAMALADRYLEKCRIDLDWAPVKPLRLGDDLEPARLRRTERNDEVILLLRGVKDQRRYKLGGVANLRRMSGGWMAETAWTQTNLGLAWVVGQGQLKRWPRPQGEGASVALNKARLAMIYAVAKGWITLAPSIADGHCAFLQKRLARLRERRARSRRRARRGREAPERSAWGLELPGAPEALLVSDVPDRNAYQAAVKIGPRWRLLTWRSWGGSSLSNDGTFEAPGEGRALHRVGGVPLLVSTTPDAVRATWARFTSARQKYYREGGRLEGCERLLATDIVRPGREQEKHPGVAVVVCADRVHQLTPLLRHEERVDALPPMRWATLTRLGPGRARLIAAHARGVRVYELWPERAPQPLKTPPSIAALARRHPDAPIWMGLNVPPVQLTSDALHTPDRARPLGAGAEAWFNPNQYRALRMKGTSVGLFTQSDSLLGRATQRATLPRGALWATQRGDLGPVLWTLTPAHDRWYLHPPAEGYRLREPRPPRAHRARRRRERRERRRRLERRRR